MLDVASGSGNMAIAAARLGCEVTGVDYVPSLLDRGIERAAAERLDVAFQLGDAEALPFADGSFDATVSVVGAMFAPDHERAAAELVRVTRPGGTIALASWTPDSFVGAMFRTVAAHVPPPRGVASPLLWGDESYLNSLFGADVGWTHRRRTFTFRFESAAAFVDRFVTYYGPTVKAVEALGAEARGAEGRPAGGRAALEPPGRRRPDRGDGGVPRVRRGGGRRVARRPASYAVRRGGRRRTRARRSIAAHRGVRWRDGLGR